MLRYSRQHGLGPDEYPNMPASRFAVQQMQTWNWKHTRALITSALTSALAVQALDRRRRRLPHWVIYASRGEHAGAHSRAHSVKRASPTLSLITHACARSI